MRRRKRNPPRLGISRRTCGSVDDDHKHHYQECQICHEKLEDTYGEHHYVPYGDDWQCSVCGQIHGFDCDGKLVPDASRSTCKHLIGYCSDLWPGVGEVRFSRASLQTIIRSARASARFAARQTRTTNRRLTPTRIRAAAILAAVTLVAATAVVIPAVETQVAVTQAVEMTAEETPAEICKEHHKRKK